MKKIVARLALALAIFSAFAAGGGIEIVETPKEQEALLKKAARKEAKTPEWAKCIRRAEIITFGSLPFTMLGVNLTIATKNWCKSGFARDAFTNPFNPSPDTTNLSKKEIKKRFAIAGGISLGIGVTDLIVHIIKLEKEKKKNTKAMRINNIVVAPIAHDSPMESQSAEEKSAPENPKGKKAKKSKIPKKEKAQKTAEEPQAETQANADENQS